MNAKKARITVIIWLAVIIRGVDLLVIVSLVLKEMEQFVKVRILIEVNQQRCIIGSIFFSNEYFIK